MDLIYEILKWIVGLVVVSLWFGRVVSGRFAEWLKIRPKGSKKGFWKTVGEIIIKIIKRRWDELRDLVKTDDPTHIYYGIQGEFVGYFERFLFTLLYVYLGSDGKSILGTLAIAWMVMKVTTYWIPIITINKETNEGKMLSYAPVMATIISLLFALLGGMFIKWEWLNT